METVESVVLDSRSEVVATGGGYEEGSWQTIIDVQRCSECAAPTFARYGWLDPFYDAPDQAHDWAILYPPQRDVEALPERVRHRYVAMLELAYAPDAFAVRAGRLLEAVCSSQGVDKTRGDLNRRIIALVAEGNLPSALAAQAHLVRNYRNLGGHDDDLEVDAGDVPLIRGFVEALLDFLFWGPAELSRANTALEKRRAALKSG